MSVGRRLMLSISTLVACTALLGAAALAGLEGLSRHYRTAEEQYGQLRSLYEIGFRAASVRLLLNAGSDDAEAIRAHLEIAAGEADKLASGRGSVGRVGRGPEMQRVASSIRARLDELTRRIGQGRTPAGLAADANRWLADLVAIVGSTQEAIVENRRRATAEFRTTLFVVIGVLGGTLVIAVLVGMRQYRSVMLPVRALDGAVTRLAGTRFDHRIGELGDLEFRRLIAQFNRMSETIDGLHSSMRRQVEAKSRQLVRSEQLAGVGSLAAGLAHEINNPLGIIAGYAQTARRKLDRASTPAEREEATARASRTLGVICEEVFRCRDIARQLLDMARPADEAPDRVPLAPLVERAAELVRHLPGARGREVIGRVIGPPDGLACVGHAPQLLQALINLLTNGLEACEPGSGRVVLTLTRERGLATITVTDNGCGMDGQTLARAFDPFFTDKPRRALSGCGLGLSISHAIVERHAGRLYAHSDGPGLGSAFTIELPIAPAQARGAIQAQERDHAGVA